MLSGTTFCINDLNSNSENKKETKISYTLISSKELIQVNDIWRENIRALFGEAQETYLEYNSTQAKKYIAELEIKFIPFVIYDNSIVTSDSFFNLVRQKVVDKVKGYYVISPEQLRKDEVMLLGRQRQPNKLDIFAMSHCPYAKEAESTLIDFIRWNKLDDIELRLRYMVDVNEFGISSRHGPKEIKENLRQIVIQKYHPDKFLDYLILVQSKKADQALEELGISARVINSKKAEALKLLREDSTESQKIGVTRSPTFLWENVYLISSLEGLKRHGPFNVKKSRPIPDEALSGPVEIDFFYSNACRHCLGIKADLLPELKSKYKDRIAINYHNVSYVDELKLKVAMEKEYGILRGSIPEIFLPQAALVGKGAIKKELSGAIEEILMATSEAVAAKKIAVEENPLLSKFFTFSPMVVMFAGLIDGINPCAFATIIFFVSLLSVSSYGKKQISYVGGAFIAGVFFTYLALGLGVFAVFKRLEAFSFWSGLIYFAVALLALGLGVYHFSDYIKYKTTGQTKGCDLKLYNRLRALVDRRKDSLIILAAGAFASGFIIALLESVCTGQVYLPTIAFVTKVANLRLQALFYLVLYNLAFILPLVIIFLLACEGATSEKFSLFTQRHYGGIKITYTLVFFGLAILLFLS